MTPPTTHPDPTKINTFLQTVLAWKFRKLAEAASANGTHKNGAN